MEMLAFLYFDPMYFVYVGPAILLAMWAQMKVKSAYAQAGKVQARSGLSGAETAENIAERFHIPREEQERLQHRRRRHRADQVVSRRPLRSEKEGAEIEPGRLSRPIARVHRDRGS